MLTSLLIASSLLLGSPALSASNPPFPEGIENYVPSEGVMAARERFRDDKFGVFIHWGVYSMIGAGEWVMSNDGISYSDYSVLPGAFYPSKFNAAEWVSAFKAAGAKYVTITSRHHDGFSMFATKASKYNIIDASPFKRDILKELADECHKQGLTINFYYSLVDWGRGDYPVGQSGTNCGKDASEADYDHYVDFMCEQITELLTNYGKVGCIWFDGDWDQNIRNKETNEIPVTFDWQYKRIYELIHSLQPDCLVANNHHRVPIAGEDIQLFERDVPGENEAGYSGLGHVSQSLPLETCKTMNKNWGYRISDHLFKSREELISILVRTAGRDANLLLNIGPRPDGTIPPESLERFAQMGEWLNANGESIYGTRATLLKPQPWGVLTHKDNRLFLHVTEAPEGGVITLPFTLKAKSVSHFGTDEQLAYKRSKTAFTITLPEGADTSLDYIIEIVTK